MRSKMCTAAMLMLAVWMTGCSQSSKQSDDVARVKTDTVRTAGSSKTLSLPGRVQAADDAGLSFRVSGVIEKICVDEGQRVRQGQVLAMLDSTDYRIQLDATEAEYSQVKAEAERIIALYEDGGISANDYDRAVYGLRQITAKLQYARDQLAYTRLEAPFSGTVGRKLVDEHEAVAAGLPIVSLVSDGQPEVEINLSASDYIRRESFSEYHCTVGVFPGVVFSLKPVGITPKANANQLYTMRLRFLSDTSPLPSPGMNTMVTIGYDDDGGKQLTVASTALLQDAGQAYVYIYQADKQTVSKRAVTLVALLSDGNAIITADNIEAGALVVTSGVHAIVDGQQVKPLPAASETNVGELL